MLDIYVVKKLEELFGNDKYLQNGSHDIALRVVNGRIDLKENLDDYVDDCIEYNSWASQANGEEDE